MYPIIEFTNETSMITSETWRFILIDSILYLDDYKLRSGKNLLKHYDRLDHNNYTRDVMISKNDVPLTKVIKQQAKTGLFETVKVAVWGR